MSLEQLDAFLAHASRQPDLAERLHDPEQPLEMEEFLRLALEAGFPLQESDVMAAQQREETHLSDTELQHRAGAEACRLRHFIPG
ncbi:MAG: Nif11-like leader peptide family RiPP precursor [Cyanobacteriota bacterium]|nr:Nif11-like leader peptide family RiPP precursor [Cyanobacteriota bacterium]